jgi:hypothetical protein
MWLHRSVSRLCAFIGSPCLRHCVHGASIGFRICLGDYTTELYATSAASACEWTQGLSRWERRFDHLCGVFPG